MRLRNNGSNVGLTSLLQILIRETGKGKWVIEKTGKRQELHKAGIVTTRVQHHPVACRSDGLRQKAHGESSSSVAGLWQQAGTRKKRQGKSRRKGQVSGCRPKRESACMHQLMRLVVSDIFLGESSSREASLRQQAGRAQSKSRRERQVMRLLMSETLFFSILVSGSEESVVRNLTSWLLIPFLSF